jgi:uncharacterized protein YecT (DUF1311 family)
MIARLAALLVVMCGLPQHLQATEICAMDGPQAQLNDCAAKRSEAADQTLNATWRKLMSVVAQSDPAYARLKDAQRSWIDYRDKMCGVYVKDRFGGSMMPMLFSLCEERLTIQQNDELLSLCEDGAIVCGD